MFNFFRSRGISSIIEYKNEINNDYTDYLNISDYGYRNNVIVFRCIRLIAESVASVNWLVQTFDKKTHKYEPTLNHPILSLIDGPNAKQSRTSFIDTIVSHLLLSGNCYIQAIKDQDNKIIELYALRPDRVSIIPGNNSIPLGYEYSVREKKILFPADENGVSDILHIKLFNPFNDWYGQSPVSVVFNSIKQHNAITKQNISFLQNGGRPSGALICHNSMTDNVKNKLRNDLRQAYEGSQNAGKILLLEGNFEWKEMGLSPKDLDFSAGKEQAAKEIALAFGVPPILIGITSNATFANYKEARYNFWEETVIPLINNLTIEFSNWLTKITEYTNLSLTYDKQSIHALAKQREHEWKRINEASFLTNDEKRTSLGFPSANC